MDFAYFLCVCFCAKFSAISVSFGWLSSLGLNRLLKSNGAINRFGPIPLSIFSLWLFFFFDLLFVVHYFRHFVVCVALFQSISATKILFSPIFS